MTSTAGRPKARPNAFAVAWPSVPTTRTPRVRRRARVSARSVVRASPRCSAPSLGHTHGRRRQAGVRRGRAEQRRFQPKKSCTSEDGPDVVRVRTRSSAIAAPRERTRVSPSSCIDIQERGRATTHSPSWWVDLRMAIEIRVPHLDARQVSRSRPARKLRDLGGAPRARTRRARCRRGGVRTPQARRAAMDTLGLRSGAGYHRERHDGTARAMKPS